jgi:hypothetical protein
MLNPKFLLNAIPWRVSAGPFSGTRCEVTSTGDGVVVKLAGTYEQEIHPAFRSAIDRRPSVIVDIGAAEGFYVSALARAVPGARVIAYETKPEWQGRIKHVAGLNGVAGRCEVRGFCDKGEFRRLLASERGRVFMLMDIEGGEFSLLEPDILPLLGGAELLVELHEPEERTAGDAVAAMLRPTHEVALIWAQDKRSLKKIPSNGWRLAATMLPPIRRRLDEGRIYQMRWMHAVPRHGAHDSDAG